MTTHWKTSKYSWTIEKIEVEKESDNFVWYKRWEGSKEPSRMAKHSSYDDVWPTEQAAIDYLRNRAITAIKAHELAIIENSKALANLSPKAE